MAGFSSIDRIVQALEAHYWDHDDQAALAELAEMDEAGLLLFGRMFLHLRSATGFVDGSTMLALLVEAAIHYAETADEGHLDASESRRPCTISRDGD